MQCVILAGGLGTRMWPEARTVPKTLLPVGGRPFAAWQLEWLSRSDIKDVVYCVGYLSDDIRAFARDGADWGLSISYVHDGEQLRGTAGALRNAYEHGVLRDEFLVLYGDSWLQVDPAAVLTEAAGRAEPALMTVHRNEGRWDGSNVVFDGQKVVRYAKGLEDPPADMCWIDYGLMVFRRDLIAARVPAQGVTDLAALSAGLAAEGLLAGLEVPDRFYEIGSAAGRSELEDLLRQRRVACGGVD